MLFLEQIDIVQFKNHDHQLIHCTHPIVAICGPNGKGKTNLLDAIYYLSFTKSYFSKYEAQNIAKGYQGFKIEARYKKQGDPLQVKVCMREIGKKELWVNGEERKKFSSHIGCIPIVMICPDDMVLINGSSEYRRKWFDMLASQISSIYIKNLIAYQKLLQEKDTLLKSYIATQQIDVLLLYTINSQLCACGKVIYEERKQIWNVLQSFIVKLYHHIIPNEDIGLQYQSALHDLSMQEWILQHGAEELLAGRSLYGIHKDDFVFYIYDHLFKNYASQGQKKTLLFALKLAEGEYIKQYKNLSPIYLLDDIFEKLDSHRLNCLLSYLCNTLHSSIFITDTESERLNNLLSLHTSTYQLICLQ